MSHLEAPFLPLPFLVRDLDLQEREGGVLLMRSRIPLGPVERHLPGVFRQRACERGSHPWLVQRRGGDWVTLTYGEAQCQIDAVTRWLLTHHPAGGTVMVLSGNSLEHAVFEMAAMQARMPYVPVTPAYSLLSQDHAKLRAMVALVAPAVVFVQSGRAFERALASLDLAGRQVLQVDEPVNLPAPALWADVLQTRGQGADTSLAASLAEIRPDTIAKILFTSGSTGVPKAVPVTQRMLCATMAMHAANVARHDDTPDSVLLEWLPWSHVAGGTAIFNSVIEDGGTMYLDEGRPVPGEFEKTLRNLREVSPTRFSSVPVGFSMLADALEADEALGRNFFRHLRRLTSSGARLPDSVYQRLQQQAVRHLGFRIPFVSSYGSTETCAATTTVHWPSERSGLVGLPQPGVELKLVPLEDARYEVRVRGPSVMAGYLDQPELNRQAFDDEGYYGMGDAVTFVNRQQPLEGLAFAGRVAEEFKLQSGIFVRVGSLRVELINAAAPLIADAVITGADRAWVGALVWLNLKACQEKSGPLSATELAADPRLRAAIAQSLRAHNARHPASSMQIRRVLVLDEPPSMDAGEVTDKGYVNQRAVLARRAAQVQALHADVPDAAVIQVDTEGL
jgi:feruloyl-CoA synthase